jgi:hypothetical protein
MIPKVIYFNFGFKKDFANKPFNIVHYIAIKSAKLVNKYDVKLYYKYAPTNNEWWEKSKEFCEHIICNPDESVFGKDVSWHAAYISDLFRLNLLIENGGIYLDVDTICIKPFDDLLQHDMVMGIELAGGKVGGLCNAIMLAEKQSLFLNRWKEKYRNYNPAWGIMSVDTPFRLAYRDESFNDMWVEPPCSFFKYGYDEVGLENIFNRHVSIDDCYALHLWEQISYKKYIAPLTEFHIKNIDSTYNLLARKYIE